MTHTATDAPAQAQPRRTDGYLPIEDYAIIGDGRTLALVGVDGWIDWMCLPDLDSPSVFGALLDPADGGSFSPPRRSRSRSAVRTSRTPMSSRANSHRAGDRPGHRGAHRGQRPERALARARASCGGDLGQRPDAVAPAAAVRLRTAHSRARRLADQFVYRYGRLQLGLKFWDAGDPQVRGGVLEASFEIGAGEQSTLAMLASDDVALPSPERRAVERRLDATVQLWKDWVGRCGYDGPWQPAVRRSLLAIRLLADGRTGAITAAGTTSLPEVIGGRSETTTTGSAGCATCRSPSTRCSESGWKSSPTPRSAGSSARSETPTPESIPSTRSPDRSCAPSAGSHSPATAEANPCMTATRPAASCNSAASATWWRPYAASPKAATCSPPRPARESPIPSTSSRDLAQPGRGVMGAG